MKIQEIKKKNGATVYRCSAYLGTDVVTGKKVKASITARTKTELKNKVQRAQYHFKQNGSTVYKKIEIKTYGELVDSWLDNYKLTVKPQSYDITNGQINNYLLPLLSNFKLDKITTSLLQKHINKLSQEIAIYKTIHSINKRILRYAVSLQLITNNPAENVILPKIRSKKSSRVKFIEKDNLKKFLDYLYELSKTNYKHYYDYVLYRLLLATGIRFGEAVALEWSDIDFENQYIHITKNYSPDHGIGTPKTKSSIRTISIDTATLTLLKEYKYKQSLLFLRLGKGTPITIFSTETKQYTQMSRNHKQLQRHIKKVGIPQFAFHAFRHTHASLLLNAGIGYKELQHRLGHTTLSMTMDTYGHISQEREKLAIHYFEQAINTL